MKIRHLSLVILIATAFLLQGCKTEEPDLKGAAKKELFQELGINEDIPKPKEEIKIPPVAPLPPVLPAIDADLGISE